MLKFKGAEGKKNKKSLTIKEEKVEVDNNVKKIAKKRKLESKVEETNVNEEPSKPIEKKPKIKVEVKQEAEVKEPSNSSFKNGNDKKKPAFKKPYDKNNNGKKFSNGKKPYSDAKAAAAAADKPQLTQKELKELRRKKKLSTNYQISVDIKKIWETLRQ